METSIQIGTPSNIQSFQFRQGNFKAVAICHWLIKKQSALNLFQNTVTDGYALPNIGF
jgi:hypothetical protein